MNIRLQTQTIIAPNVVNYTLEVSPACSFYFNGINNTNLKGEDGFHFVIMVDSTLDELKALAPKLGGEIRYGDTVVSLDVREGNKLFSFVMRDNK